MNRLTPLQALLFLTCCALIGEFVQRKVMAFLKARRAAAALLQAEEEERFKAQEMLRRRANYDFLKTKIADRHFSGCAGLVVDFPELRLDRIDYGCFGSPMYCWVKNKDDKWCVFWDRGRMTKEIGVGGPISDGEQPIPEGTGRMAPSSNLETIDEAVPLTVKTPEASDADGEGS